MKQYLDLIRFVGSQDMADLKKVYPDHDASTLTIWGMYVTGCGNFVSFNNGTCFKLNAPSIDSKLPCRVTWEPQGFKGAEHPQVFKERDGLKVFIIAFKGDGRLEAIEPICVDGPQPD